MSLYDLDDRRLNTSSNVMKNVQKVVKGNAFLHCTAFRTASVALIIIMESLSCMATLVGVQSKAH